MHSRKNWFHSRSCVTWITWNMMFITNVAIGIYSYDYTENAAHIFFTYQTTFFFIIHCFNSGHQQRVLPVECRGIFTPSDPDVKESSGPKRQTMPAVGMGRLSASYSTPPAVHRPAPATRLPTSSSCRGAAHLS